MVRIDCWISELLLNGYFSRSCQDSLNTKIKLKKFLLKNCEIIKVLSVYSSGSCADIFVIPINIFWESNFSGTSKSTHTDLFYYFTILPIGSFISFLFYFLITYGVCKKRKYWNRRSQKKNSLLLTNVHVLYVLEDKTSTKNFPSVCLSVYLVVWLYVRGLFMWTQ